MDKKRVTILCGRLHVGYLEEHVDGQRFPRLYDYRCRGIHDWCRRTGAYPAYEFGWYCLVTFSGATAEMMGQTIPVVIQSKDGRHSKTLTLTVKESYEGARIASTGGIHVAQQRRISVKNASEVGITKVRFSETSSPRKLSFSGSEFSNPSAEVTVDLLKPGEATVKIEGYRGGSWVTLATQKFTIYKPTLRAVDASGRKITTAIELSMDGAPQYCKLQYCSKSGLPMRIATGSESADGVCFDASLYNALLKPQKVSSATSLGDYVDFNGTDILICRFSSSTSGDIVDHVETSGQKVTVTSTADLGITCDVPIYIQKPFKLTSAMESVKKLGKIEYGRSLDEREPVFTPYGNLYGGGKIFTRVLDNQYVSLYIENGQKFGANVNHNDQLWVKDYAVGTAGYGKKSLLMKVTNRVRGESRIFTVGDIIICLRIYTVLKGELNEAGDILYADFENTYGQKSLVGLTGVTLSQLALDLRSSESRVVRETWSWRFSSDPLLCGVEYSGFGYYILYECDETIQYSNGTYGVADTFQADMIRFSTEYSYEGRTHGDWAQFSTLVSVVGGQAAGQREGFSYSLYLMRNKETDIAVNWDNIEISDMASCNIGYSSTFKVYYWTIGGIDETGYPYVILQNQPYNFY